MTGFWWGVAATTGVALLVSMIDRDFRKTFLDAAWAVLAAPLWIIAIPLLAVNKLMCRPRRLSPAALVRIAHTVEMRGFSISRRGRVVLVLTEPKRPRASALRGETHG